MACLTISTPSRPPTSPQADLAARGRRAGSGRNSPFVPLRQPIFRAVWFASLASNFGGLIQTVGASWMMTSIAASPDMVALVQASTTLPVMLFSLAAGAISDNYDRRRIMLTAQGFMFCVSIVLAVFAWFGLLTPWLLLGFTFLIGCGTALNNPAWQSSVGDMVPRPRRAGRGDAEQRRLQHRPQRRPGHRRRHRRGARARSPPSSSTPSAMSR